MTPVYKDWYGNDWYGHILIGYGSAAFKHVLSDPKFANDLPLSSDFAISLVFAYLHQWCEDYCKGKWMIDPMSHCHWIFADPKDAMLFKLTHI